LLGLDSSLFNIVRSSLGEFISKRKEKLASTEVCMAGIAKKAKHINDQAQ
jgi:hypothetical protein